MVSYEMHYNNLGNIEWKTDVGDYRYDADRPHAMSGIAGAPGAGISGERQTITYTAFHKIETVAQNDDVYRIEYGLNNQRIKTTYLRNGEAKLTRRYFGAFEIETDSLGNETLIDYVFTPSGLTAIAKTQGGDRSIYYVHTDNLGSIRAITDSGREIVAEYAYTPWGGRILLTGDGAFTNRGYTGHEHLEPLGLINMNGRVFDPTLARFLSPDPYVQAPDFTQSYNRYWYSGFGAHSVIGNSALFNDPTLYPTRITPFVAIPFYGRYVFIELWAARDWVFLSRRFFCWRDELF